ncbi:pyridoxal phosphate-dependent aminotransferase [bacterium]|jgi:aspartate aminotransferase|nr:pyridoxal phosphate-dependent aminotransferase [bacterium]MBT3850648.1 pyridoxal phosphate-dependent aminotransferase [bacterium]MBT4435882.1 pyridoxal phosphate-dependent aminotransferase [bacterium]|tara:strand:- start:5227 stop:6420 length:1194 start_codon:yes stop_codon:yes gene_type:complete
MKLSKLAKTLKPSATLAITAKAKDLKSQGIDIIGFGAGEPDFDTPENIKSSAKISIDEGFTKYTAASGIIELKEAIRERIQSDYGINYQNNEILVGSGAKHVLYNLFNVLVDNGDEVLIPSPYWVSYPEQVKICGGIPVILETSQETGFKITKEQIESKCSNKTKILVLNFPSNPTGSTYNREELMQIAKVAQEKDLIVISDEIYDKIVYSGIKHVSFPELSDDAKERTILVNGVSKTYSMTGWRIGYAAGNPKVISAMNNLSGQSTSNPTSISQKAAIEAFSGTQEKVKEMLAEFETRKNYISSYLNEIKDIECFVPDGAFYVFPNISAYFGKKYNDKVITNSLEFTDFLLDVAKVAVVPGVEFGSDSHIRISYATSMSDIKQGLERIKESLSTLI